MRALPGSILGLALVACRATSDAPPGKRVASALASSSAKAGACERGRRVCGRDKRTYDDECAARASGVELSVTGGCKAVVPDHIPCGARYCDARAEYCEIYLSDVPELPSGYRCRPLPAACLPDREPPPTCACFPPGTPCLSFCGPTWTGGIPGFHLTCQGVREPEKAVGDPG